MANNRYLAKFLADNHSNSRPGSEFELFFTSDASLTTFQKYLTLVDKGKLTRLSMYTYSLFQPNLNKIAFAELLQAIIDDNRNKVKQILSAKPMLLLHTPEKEQVVKSQYSWQIFRADKPLQMALKRKQLGMVKLLLPYFKELENRGFIDNAKKIVLAQWALCAVSKLKKNQYTSQLEQLISVIAIESFPNGIKGTLSAETEKVLNDFRKKMLPDTAIDLDNYIDIELFIMAAYDIYNDKFNHFQTDDQRDLFCICVIGFAQSLVPPELAKILCEGLYHVVNDNRQLSERAAKLLLLKSGNETIPFYRDSQDSRTGLGYHYLCYGLQKYGGWAGLGGMAGSIWIYTLYEKLHQKRTNELNNLHKQLKSGHWPKDGPQQRPSCSIQ